MKGKEIKSLLDIESNCTQLVLCEDTFQRVDASNLLKNDEELVDFAKRLISGANFQIDGSIDRFAATPSTENQREIEHRIRVKAKKAAKKKFRKELHSIQMSDSNFGSL